MCGPGTWYQLDRYLLESKDELDHLIGLMENGLGWHNGKPGDQSPHHIYNNKHYFFSTSNGEDCTNTGQLEVCVPDSSTASGYAQGALNWNYTLTAEGVESHTTDPSVLADVLHPAFVVNDHNGIEHHSYDAHDDWDPAFYSNNCAGLTEICVPLDHQQDNGNDAPALAQASFAAESSTTAVNPWKIIEVTEQERADDYPNAPTPDHRGWCDYEIFVCWEITGDPYELFDEEQLLVQYKYQNPDGTVTFYSLTDCFFDTPRCGDDVRYQLDLYSIESKSDHELLDELLTSGTLGLNDNGSPEDSRIYKSHMFVKQAGQDCTNSGSVPVCVPHDYAASGYVPGSIDWTYTQDAEGNESYTTDPAELEGYLHAGFDILTHGDEPDTHATIAATWNGEGTFEAYLENLCQTDVEICVPVDYNGNDNTELAAKFAETPSVPTNPWMVKTVSEQERADDYPNAQEPNKNGYCDFEIYVCWEITGGVDLLALTGPEGERNSVFKANFTPDAQQFIGWGNSFDALKALEDCAPTPVCGDMTAFQLDLYKIVSDSEYATLLELIDNGLGMDGNKYGDHTIYGDDHLIIRQDGEDCTNSGTVPVCVPHDDAASGYVPGSIEWTYTKTADGTESYTTDPEELEGYLHAGFDVLTHEEPPVTFETIAATWNGEGTFEAYLANLCQTDVEICVPVDYDDDNNTEVSARVVGTPGVPTNPWMVITVSEQERADNYPNAHEPNKNGYCDFEIYVCWEITGGVDLLAVTGPEGERLRVQEANFDPKQQFIGWGDSFNALKALEDCAPTPLCGEMTAFQLDKYEILSDDDYSTLTSVIANGLGLDNGRAEDRSIYVTHLVIKQNGEDCTNSGNVPVCVPHDDAASGYVPGTIEWTYTKTADGTESYTTNPEELAGYLHAGFDILTHEDPPVTFETIAATWSGEGTFVDFLRNKCAGPDEYCPIVLEGDANEWVALELYPWEKAKFVHYKAWTGDPEDCFKPTGRVDVCVPTHHGDGWTELTIPWKAYWGGENGWSFYKTLFGLPVAAFDSGDSVFGFPWLLSLEDTNVIVPPITSEHYGVAVDHPGVNWTPLNQAIYGTGCDPVDEIIDVDLVHVTCENPEGGAIDAAYRVATGNGNVQIRLFRMVEGEKVYLNVDGTPAAEGSMPILQEIIEGAGQHDFGVSGLTHGEYGFETVSAVNQLTYGATFTIERPEEECATLNPDILSGICIDGIPYMDFTIVVEDKFEEVNLEEGAVMTLSDDTGTEAPYSHIMDTIPLAKATQDGITYSYDESTMTHTWTGEVLWPGASVDPQGWPGWAFDEATGTYVNVGDDNFGWTRDGMNVHVKVNPEAEFEADVYPSEQPDCPNPPTYDICEWDEERGVPVQTTLYGIAPEDAILWNGGAECTPVEICVLLEGDPETGEYGSMVIMASELNEEIHQMWNPEAEVQGGCREAQEPALDGSLFTSVCLADSPWLDYEVELYDPDNQYEGDGTVTITFINPDGEDYVLTDDSLMLTAEGTLAGRTLWPGASVEAVGGGAVDPYDASTFVPTGWPGWHQDLDGNWFEDASPQDNFGWTRNGVDVRIEVNPELIVTLNYPPATPDCAGNPPENPTLEGSFLSSVCVADSPWLTYDVELKDPDEVSTDDGMATITFVHPTDASQNVVVEVPIGSGYVMWPGASVEPAEGYTEADIDPTNPDTFVPTGWPGWAQDASGEWIEIGLDNFGWTRFGIEVRLDVNPSTSLTVNYPPPTPTCVSAPAQNVSAEAPAATAVAATVITYTG